MVSVGLRIISLVCSLFFELVLGDPSGGPWSLVHLVPWSWLIARE